MSILTPQEFATLRPEISKGWSKESGKIQQCIDDAESVDLYDVLSDFYFSVVENVNTAEWQDLFDGVDFTIEGIKYEHAGLKSYIAGLAYSRYLGKANSTWTPHGFVNKISQDSEPVNWNQIRDERKDTDKTNEVRFIIIDKYLRSKPELFVNYATGNNPDINTNSVKTSNLR